jgi:hypothetical protein
MAAAGISMLLGSPPAHGLPVDFEVVPALSDGAVGAQRALVGSGWDHALPKAGAALEAAAAAAVLCANCGAAAK